MKLTGALLLILGILMLVGGIVCLFVQASPKLMGALLILSILANAIGITMLTTKTKR